MGKRLMLAVALAAAASAARAADTVRACPDAPTEFSVVTAVGSDLTLTLGDGRVLRLVGVEPPRSTAAAPNRPDDVRASVRRALGDSTIGFGTVGSADRWGLVPARVFDDSGDLAEQLLDQGAVRRLPDRISGACRDGLVRAEASARDAHRGVWADGELVVRSASDVPAALPDGMVVVEGDVASVGETPARLYINLGQRRGGFAISVAKRDIALMQSEAVTKSRTIGARVRVRGLADGRDGVRLVVSDPDALEIVPAAPPGKP